MRTNTEERNVTIDVVRGIGVILVVVGHAIQHVVSDANTFPLWVLIYSFHMPLFMLVSGYVTYREGKSYDPAWLKNKFVGLMFPWAVWTLVPFIIKGNWNDFPRFLYNVWRSPDHGYWFLYILFLNHVVLFIATNLADRIGKYWDLIVLGVVFVTKFLLHRGVRMIFGYEYGGIGFLSWYIVFYFAGFYIHRYQKGLEGALRVIIPILALLWIGLVPFWRFGVEPSFALTLYRIVPLVAAKGLLLLYKYLIPFGGGGALCFLIAWVFSKKRSTRWIGEFGQHSLEIYVLQKYFFNIFPLENKLIAIVVNVIMGLIFPYLISKISREKRLGYYMFGR